MVDQMLFLLGNITGTSASLRRRVDEHLDVISILERILELHKTLPMIFAQNFIWVATNYSLDGKALTFS